MGLSFYSRALSLTLLCLLLSSCSSWPKLRQIEVKTVQVDRAIPIQARPQPVKLHDITWFVVTDQNFKEFKKRYTKLTGTFLFYAISVRDYEALALNLASIRRYILAQKGLISYYEDAARPRPKNKKEVKK